MAEVTTHGLLMSPWEQACLPNAPAPGRLLPPPWQRDACPVPWAVVPPLALCFSQASCKALLGAARFLKRRDLEQLLTRQQALKFNDCLVRTAWKAQPQPGEGACPLCSVCGAGSCVPAQCCSQGHQPEPHTLLPSMGCAGSCPGSSGLWHCQWSRGPAVLQGSPTAPQAAPGPLPPPKPGTCSSLRAAWAEARAGCRERPAQGQSPRQPFPLSSLCSR